MNNPKRHHYVHEKYIEEFYGDDGCVNVIDKWEKGRIFSTTAKNVLNLHHYYSQPVYDESRMDAKLETLFSEVEGYWPEIISHLKLKKPIDDRIYGFIAQTHAMLRSRVPNTRKAIEACLQASVKNALDELDEEVPNSLIAPFSKANSNVTKLERDGQLTMSKLVDLGLLNVGIDPHRSLHLMPNVIISLSAVLGRMKCRSFLHNKTGTDFISSDNPVIFFPKEHDRNKNPQPFNVNSEDDFVFIFPVSPKIIQYYDSTETKRNEHRYVRSAKTVAKINTDIAFFADRFVISNDKNQLGVAKPFLNKAPIPNFEHSNVHPGGLVDLRYTYGDAIKSLPNWKYDFS